MVTQAVAPEPAPPGGWKTGTKAQGALEVNLAHPPLERASLDHLQLLACEDARKVVVRDHLLQAVRRSYGARPLTDQFQHRALPPAGSAFGGGAGQEEAHELLGTLPLFGGQVEQLV